MPAHKWSSKIHSSSCSRCGAIRTAHRFLDSGQKSDLPVSFWSYRLPDGLGSIETRPPCSRPTESRRTRKMNRRAKVLARSRAGGPRLISAHEAARRALRGTITLGLIPEGGPTISIDSLGAVHLETTTANLSGMTVSVGAEGVEP